MRIFTYLGLAFLSSVAWAGFPSPDAWRDQNIYFIFMDRFSDGDPANNNVNPEQAFNAANSRGIHGGDFKGIQQKLDYIKALGASAIWITPIPKNAGSSSYHGYGAHDMTQVAPHWGTQEDLSNMVAAAHAKGIYVILDIVVNHMGNRITSSDSGFPAYKDAGYNLRWSNATNQYPAPFDSTNYFHNKGNINNYVDPNQILGDLSNLDDLKTDTAYVRTNLALIYSNWIARADFDGYRIDTTKHVDMDFWRNFNPAIRAAALAFGKSNFFQFGEVFDGSESKCGSYTGTKNGTTNYCQDSVLDYPLYFQVEPTFADATGGTQPLEGHYNSIAANYDPNAEYRLVTFLDNHDQQRFMSSGKANNNTNKLNVALGWMYTSRGIPCLYYGTEQNFNGGGDPNNREDMFDGLYEQTTSLGDNFNMTQGSFLLISKLNNFRRNYVSLRRGIHANLWQDGSPGRFAYSRQFTSSSSTEEVFVVFNTSGSTQVLPARPTLYAAGTTLVNLLNTNETMTIIAGQDGIPAVTVTASSIKMFVAQSQWKPLDPVVVRQSPAHDLVNVSPTSAVVLTFSKTMDTNSVQSAFGMTPPAAGSFSWNAARDQMTFTPPPAGLAGSTTIVVRVNTNAVDSVSTNGMWASFETFFRTTANSFTDAVPPAISIAQPLPAATLAGLIGLSGTATDNVGVTRVEFRLDGDGWITATGTTTWAYTFDTALFLNGTHNLEARSFDGVGNVSTSASTFVRFVNVPGAYDVAISPGNPADATNCDASVWVSDRPFKFASFGYVGGSSGILANAVSGICAQAQSLYQRERYSTDAGGFRYLFDCPPGIYETTLLESETFATGPGQRVFSLDIEGVNVLTNYDIFVATTGMNNAVTLTYTNGVADAQMELHFIPQGIGNARASGIRVRRIGDVDSDSDGIPDWWMLAYFDHPTGLINDNSLPELDADLDGFSNLEEYVALTDPNNPASYFRIENINGGEVWLPSASGRFYQLEINGLTDQTWSAIESNWPGNGSLLVIPDTNAPDARLYRARVTLP